MLDYASLAAVAAVVQEGSFERAARILNVTPSAISQRVKLLEERLGSVLIVRGQPCRATEAGLLLCRHAEQVGMLEHDLRKALPQLTQNAQRNPHVTLRIAVNADTLGSWFIAAMAAFTGTEQALLDIAVDDQEHTVEWLRSGEVLAVVTSIESTASARLQQHQPRPVTLRCSRQPRVHASLLRRRRECNDPGRRALPDLQSQGSAAG